MNLEAFTKALAELLPPERILTDEFRRFALSVDASCFHIVPRLVVQVENEVQMVHLIRTSQRFAIPLTFRAAGTSEFGQAISDTVLVLLTDDWVGHRIEPLGEIIHLQAGVIGATANQLLKPYGRKIGPDPGSINACKVAGIIANNASGARSGIKHNSYHTLTDMRVILPDGSLLDTRDPENSEKFRESHPVLLDRLVELRERVVADSSLVEKIQNKYQITNSSGYCLNALLDFEDPIDILIHLMVGSEGSLGFISEVSLRTVEQCMFGAVAAVAFDSVPIGRDVAELLKQLPIAALEVFDQNAVSVLASLSESPSFIKSLPDGSGLLLIDIQANSMAEIQQVIDQIEIELTQVLGVRSSGFTSDSMLVDQYWKMSTRLLSNLSSARGAGSFENVEDLALPLEQFPEGFDRLHELCLKYDYADAVIWGHALHGTLQLVFSHTMETQQQIKKYNQFSADLANVVIELGGAVSGVQGTGRLKAPFVGLEWGESAHKLMTDIKSIFDVNDLFNSGVIVVKSTENPIYQYRSMASVDENIDRCTECGLCESACPSGEVSLSPRQRIATFREIARKKRAKEVVPAIWHDEFERLAVDTCVTTGLCANHCPMNINTAELVLKIRARNNHRYKAIANSLSKHYAAAGSWFRTGLRLGSSLQRLFGAQNIEDFSIRLRHFTKQKTPFWSRYTPMRAGPVYARNELIRPTARDTVVYWPSCVTQSMGGSISDDRGDIPSAVQNVLKKAQLRVVYPQPTRGLCCGQNFKSKGHQNIADRMLNEVIDALWEVSSAGRYPVLSDTSACSLRVKQKAAERGIQLYDSSEFIDKFLLDRLRIESTPEAVAIHITCSSQMMGLENSFKRVVSKLTPNWVQPENINCCGFAGDKGFTHPEINASALKGLDTQVKDCQFGISNNRTCEIGLSHHSGITYYSIFEVLDKHSSEITGVVESSNGT